MTVHKQLVSWWEGLRRVARLTRAAQDADAALRKAYEEAEAKKLKGDEFEQYTGQAWNEYSWSSDALEDEHHARLIRRAYRLRVPIPQRTKGSTDWEESKTGRWRLTEGAAHKLRQSVAEEIETRQRPWLNWASVAISVLSLIVAILALGIAQ